MRIMEGNGFFWARSREVKTPESGPIFFFLGVRRCEEINASMNKTCENIGKMRQVKFCRRICSLMFDSAKSCEMYLYIDKIIIENLYLVFEVVFFET